MSKESKAIVTGGAGFIGSHLIEKLLSKGYEVICLDNFDPYYSTQTKKRNVELYLKNDNFTLVKGDIRDIVLLKDLFCGVDYIFHQAAQAGVRTSVDNPMKPHEVNATGTLNLLKTALDFDIKKFIFASSSSVYGQISYLPFDEQHPTFPVSPYGVSKLMAEHYCRVFSELYGLKTISLRYFTVYGPRMRPDLAISIFTKAALQNSSITIFGDGSKTRDFTYVDDIVDANMIAMHKGKGEYNIGGGHSISIMDLADTIISVTGSTSDIVFKECIKGDAEHTLANNEKAKRELDWKPMVTINDGIRKYVDWMISQNK
ncbi:UDP-glucose 4-epimerase [Methanosarcina barkeri 3]|uniref:UDP-glucose 4-epimerase n=1 Tax=Methanosarcina barkeri 3 TaxID=1434107 RepID=A0A0E3WWH5_METBA|nr:SDR family oxidoreductase [Methanosarcina barkeri]AKB82180.1 UDP-glucose 4-epimerase [Methanosarcina barkeri 3]